MPRLEKQGLRDCQYEAEIEFEKSFKAGNKKKLAVLATGSGKTYLACLASYRLLNYTSTKRILFLVDRNNLAKSIIEVQWILDMLVLKAFVYQSDDIKNDDELTRAFEGVLQSLVELDNPKAAVIMDEFRVH